MDRAATHPLTVEVAKARLRAVAGHAGLGGWVRQHPLDALVISFVAGMVLGGGGRLNEFARHATSLLLRGR